MIIFRIAYNGLSMQWSEKDSNCIIFAFVPLKNNEIAKKKVGARATEKIFFHKRSEAFYRDIFGRKALSLNDITHVEVHRVSRDWNLIQKVRLNYFLWNPFLRNASEEISLTNIFDQEVLMAVNTEIFRYLTSNVSSNTKFQLKSFHDLQIWFCRSFWRRRGFPWQPSENSRWGLLLSDVKIGTVEGKVSSKTRNRNFFFLLIKLRTTEKRGIWINNRLLEARHKTYLECQSMSPSTCHSSYHSSNLQPFRLIC